MVCKMNNIPIELPKTVLVGWKTFDIEIWHPQLAKEKNRYGECDHAGSVIRIDIQYGNKQTLETLIHELLHAAIDVGGINQDKTKDGSFTEEHIVSYMASWLTTLLVQNPILSLLMWQVTGEIA